MSELNRPIRILMADDDPDDQLLAWEALEENQLEIELHCVEDGEEVVRYLREHAEGAGSAKSSLPDLILMDLNMPRKDGRETIQEIKRDDRLRRIPVVVLTTSHVEEDIVRSYDLGVSGFIVKPVTSEQLVAIMHSLVQYWFQTVQMPNRAAGV